MIFFDLKRDFFFFGGGGGVRGNYQKIFLPIEKIGLNHLLDWVSQVSPFYTTDSIKLCWGQQRRKQKLRGFP